MVPIVLVVDDDERARRLVRMGLELEGVAVVEAESVARARAVLHRNIGAVVLDRQLPDGDGLDLLPTIAEVTPGARVVVHSTVVDGREPDGVARVDKGDLPAIIDSLGLALYDDAAGARSDDEPASPQVERLAVIDLVRAEASGVASDWEELCQWDPLLPPGNRPPVSRRVVDAVADALERPQPLGWGPDPALAQVTELFATSAGAVDIAIGQLVCLRETLRRRVSGQVPPEQEAETQARIDMILDRAIWAAARIAAARIERHSDVDAMTGLGSRAAFERELEREVLRAARYGRSLSVVVVHVPGATRPDTDADLDLTDGSIRRLASTLVTNLRAQDAVFRVAADLIAVIAPETDADGVAALTDRLRHAPRHAIACGASTYPDDAADAVSLVDEASRRSSRASA